VATNTKAILKAQILDDLARSDLTTQVDTAIDWALNYYADDRFWFNEVVNASTTLSSSLAMISFSVLPYRFQKIDRLRLELNSIYYDLYHRDYDWIMARQDMRVVAQPMEYCVYADKVQFDVLADQNYTLNIDGLVSLANAASNTYTAQDASEWFNTASELIRSAVKRNLYSQVLKDPDMASVCVQSEQDAYSFLKGITNRKKTTGYIRANQF